MPVHIKQVAFLTSAFQVPQIPRSDLPEIAFAGRSNAGKSSLMNRLFGRRNLVRTSARPGFTQSLNFFLVNERACFVDLPGYGFAKAPKGVQQQWRDLIEGYLNSREGLQGVVCVFDIRRLPDARDIELLDYLHALGKTAWIVLNKADKLSQPKRIGQLKAIRNRLPGWIRAPFVVSARTGEGVEALLQILGEPVGLIEEETDG